MPAFLTPAHIGVVVQAWDADLDALAALTGTNTIYYRSAANTWSAVTIGSNLTFVGGSLSAATQFATWGSITGTLSAQSDLQSALDLKANLASPSLTGTPTAPTPSSVDNSTKIATTAYVQAVVALAVAGLLEFKSDLDCSANPNYPAANKGDTYYVSAAGKVGGASGPDVAVGDAVICKADASSGDHAAVGSSWFILEKNLAGAALTANNLSDLASAATARTNLGLGTGDSPQFTALNIGHASDTTIARVSAGDISVENNLVYRAGGTDVPITDGGTGASTASAARDNLGVWNHVYQTADFIKNSDTTLADTSLAFTVPNGERYEFQCNLYIDQDSTGRLKYRFNSAGTPTTTHLFRKSFLAALGASNAHDTDINVTSITSATTNRGTIEVTGFIYNNTGSAITVTLQVAQNSSSAFDTKLFAGSRVSYRKVQ